MVYFYRLKMFQVYRNCFLHRIYAQQFPMEVAMDFISLYKGIPKPNILVKYVIKICLFLVQLMTLYY
jgi:hypothetical protein